MAIFPSVAHLVEGLGIRCICRHVRGAGGVCGIGGGCEGEDGFGFGIKKESCKCKGNENKTSNYGDSPDRDALGNHSTPITARPVHRA